MVRIIDKQAPILAKRRTEKQSQILVINTLSHQTALVFTHCRVFLDQIVK